MYLNKKQVEEKFEKEFVCETILTGVKLIKEQRPANILYFIHSQREADMQAIVEMIENEQQKWDKDGLGFKVLKALEIQINNLIK